MVKRLIAYEDRSIPAVFKNWIFAYSRKNYWKVAGLIDFDDLIQEGYVSYLYCKELYGDIDPPHLMYMLKLRFSQFVIDTAKKRTGLAEVHPLDNVRDGLTEENIWDRLLKVNEMQSISLLLSEAPPLVRRVLALFVNDETLAELQKSYSRENNQRKETTNERLCRLIGIDYDPDIDLTLLVQRYLTW